MRYRRDLKIAIFLIIFFLKLLICDKIEILYEHITNSQIETSEMSEIHKYLSSAKVRSVVKVQISKGSKIAILVLTMELNNGDLI